jgi:flagellin
MPQVINTNVLSLNAQRNLNASQNSLQTSLERLSSGLRINSAKDDAAGLAISERFTTQIRGTNQAIRNANDGISFAQTAEGALSTIGNNMQRIRELAVQSVNDSNSATDRQALNQEVNQLIAEINRVALSTEFNGQKVLDGSLTDLVFQVGANQNQTISVSGVDARGSELGAEVAESDAIVNSDIAASGGAAIVAGDFTDIAINGVTIDLSEASSIDSVVNLINAEYGNTEVQATRSATVETKDLAFTAAGTAASTNTLTINGVAISITSADAVADVIDKINDRSSQTGVSAVAGSGAGTLRLSANQDISLSLSENDGALTIAGLVDGDAESYLRGVDLTTEFGGTISFGGTDAAALGFNANTVQQTFTVNAASVATREDANDVIRTMDLALQQVSSLRSELGAVQVRFESTISNLGVAVENLSASRSRILDADFASETANLTRAQILQQAGISVLSQANAQPQNVLSLLQ